MSEAKKMYRFQLLVGSYTGFEYNERGETSEDSQGNTKTIRYHSKRNNLITTPIELDKKFPNRFKRLAEGEQPAVESASDDSDSMVDDEMTLDQLKQLAMEMELDTSKLRTKAQFIEAIRTAEKAMA